MKYAERSWAPEKRGARICALTELLRWSGLRIRDAVTLERSRLVGNKLLLYQAKTGTPVYVPLPPHVVELLRNIPDGLKPNPTYFFWSGNALGAGTAGSTGEECPKGMSTSAWTSSNCLTELTAHACDVHAAIHSQEYVV